MAMASIPFNIARIFDSQFKCSYLKNEKLFLNFLFLLWNLQQILNILNRKDVVIGNVFPNLKAVKILVTKLSKKRRFRKDFDSQHVKVSKILQKSPSEHFSRVFSSFRGKLIWKMSPLLLGEILEVFFNTLTPDGKYPIQDWENLELPIQMQLSEKPKTFSEIFCSISGLHMKF